ncbi:MAG: peptidoglycan-binding protein, partial [Mastigocladus sp. ERB_26_1]
AFNITVLKLPVLKIGSNGIYVSAWQSFLKEAEYPIQSVDGEFGKGTDEATRIYQQRNGLEADGIVGNGTYSKAATQG